MAKNWKPLDEARRKAWPHGRMGGGLLALTIVAGWIAIPFVLGVLALLAWVGVSGLEPLADALFSPSESMRIASLIFLIPSLTFSILCVVFFVMTLARARATPAVTVAGFGIQFLVGLVSPIAGQAAMFAKNGMDLSGLWVLIPSYAPGWFIALFMTFGLWSYLLGGVRPNAYYRNRVAVPSAPPAAQAAEAA
ncbi:hypothetical protein [Chenggangzhangella methanolivorans]|uniref:Uncharacterized protein n=1 Tax=Chenggangzhangella methanolivorans TaxID=1437009 RepID=A0A9E6UN13_9HYPH|nr:hypothetical protein [Chenggangzhangella methanolivorans]QZN99718.1 hypothetical protein K6K41_24075 [Chenggangzhangella methanolivorans]